uniref:Uncharacterized protein n=1 Tax=Rhizophora mucronata TaxID=61149 RepID=A0A2P2PF58_RHIMU
MMAHLLDYGLQYVLVKPYANSAFVLICKAYVHCVDPLFV